MDRWTGANLRVPGVSTAALRPSHDGAVPYFDKVVALCRRAGFTDVLLRGDTDFALTTAFDR